jgi:hypothetical protein
VLPPLSGPKAWLQTAKSALQGRASADAAAAHAAKKLHRNLEKEQRLYTELDVVIYLKLLNPLQARCCSWI